MVLFHAEIPFYFSELIKDQDICCEPIQWQRKKIFEQRGPKQSLVRFAKRSFTAVLAWFKTSVQIRKTLLLLINSWCHTAKLNAEKTACKTNRAKKVPKICGFLQINLPSVLDRNFMNKRSFILHSANASWPTAILKYIQSQINSRTQVNLPGRREMAIPQNPHGKESPPVASGLITLGPRTKCPR